jgi:hypothetical protein
MRDQAKDGFDRVLVADGIKIKSTCLKCGFVIVSSVSEGLEKEEREHLATCAGRKSVASPSSSRRAS